MRQVAASTNHTVGASIARPPVRFGTAAADGQWPPLQFSSLRGAQAKPRGTWQSVLPCDSFPPSCLWQATSLYTREALVRGRLWRGRGHRPPFSRSFVKTENRTLSSYISSVLPFYQLFYLFIGKRLCDHFPLFLRCVLQSIVFGQSIVLQNNIIVPSKYINREVL